MFLNVSFIYKGFSSLHVFFWCFACFTTPIGVIIVYLNQAKNTFLYLLYDSSPDINERW
jgi:hypothetical protein